MTTPQPTLSYFGMQASFGITKHMGGRRSTDALAQMACPGPQNYFLVIGCGIGATPGLPGPEIGPPGGGHRPVAGHGGLVAQDARSRPG